MEKHRMMPRESSHMPYMPRREKFYMLPHHHHLHYVVIKEPYLHEQLSRLHGHGVEVATECGKTVRGTLREVHPDYIRVKGSGRNYFIRLKSVCFVTPVMDP